MAGLVPAIHVFLHLVRAAKTRMPGTRPGMTNDRHYRATVMAGLVPAIHVLLIGPMNGGFII